MKWAVIPNKGSDEGEVIAVFKDRSDAEWFLNSLGAKGIAKIVERTAFPLGESQKLVAEFMTAAGHQIRFDRWPSIPTDLNLRRALIREEHYELQTAFDQRDALEILDGACDLQYVLDGLWVRMGLNKAPFFREVHRSNMTKDFEATEGHMVKVVKGSDFEPPDLIRVLHDEVGNEQAENFLR